MKMPRRRSGRGRTVEEVIASITQPIAPPANADAGGQQITGNNQVVPRVKLTESFFRSKLRRHYQVHGNLPSKTSLRKLPKEMKSFICMTCFESHTTKNQLIDHLSDPFFDHRAKKKKFKAKKKVLVDVVNAELGLALASFEELHAVYGQMSANLKYRYEYLLYLTICQVKLSF